MLDRLSRAFFHALANSGALKRLASGYGMRQPDGFARRFIAGETIDDAIAAARTIQASGMTLTLDYLGESVGTMAEADAATRAYLGVIERVVAAGIERNISLKLTQLGLTIDRATSVDNLRRILDAAAPHDFFVRVDMENSAFTDATLEIFATMWQQGYRNVGVVLQSYLPRSLDDARRLNRLGARVRLVKGALYSSRPRARLRPIAASPRRLTNFRCCTACAATCRPRWSPRDTAFAYTSHSGANGSRTSCAGSESGPPMWRSSFEVCCATAELRCARSGILMWCCGVMCMHPATLLAHPYTRNYTRISNLIHVCAA
jgi:hypothetical protein